MKVHDFLRSPADLEICDVCCHAQAPKTVSSFCRGQMEATPEPMQHDAQEYREHNATSRSQCTVSPEVGHHAWNIWLVLLDGLQLD